MCSNPHHLWNDAAKRCAICGGRFGLVSVLHRANRRVFKKVQ